MFFLLLRLAYASCILALVNGASLNHGGFLHRNGLWGFGSLLRSDAFPRPVVDLGYAKYKGTQDAVTGLTTFLGIRYAQAPRGDLRWRAPQEPDHTPEILDASLPGPQCHQGLPGAGRTNPFEVLVEVANSLLRRGGQDDDASEDCLVLNVYSPKDTQKWSLPVVVWIHGGGYAFGHAANTGRDLVHASNGNVVVVMIQYRLGLLGFLPGSEVKKNGVLNAGLLDQQFALQWVQKYISLFGGDPQQVTIWGESAGAGSVIQHLIANNGSTNPPLFNRAITSSTFLPFQYKYNDTIPEKLFAQTAEEAGCEHSQDIMSCLRQLPIESLRTVNTDISRNDFQGEFQYVPVVDGTLIQQSPVTAIENRALNKVEAYLGITNTNEGAIFVNSHRHIDSLEDYVSNAVPTLESVDIQRVVQTYSNITGLDDIHSQAVAVQGELIFICPTYYLLNAFGGKAHKGEFAVLPANHGNDMAYYFPGGRPTFVHSSFAKSFSQSFMDVAVTGDVNLKLSPDNETPLWPAWSGLYQEMIFNVTDSDLGQPNIHVTNTDPGLISRCELWRSLAPKTGQ